MSVDSALDAILWVCGAVVTIGAAIALMWKGIKPVATMKKDVEDMKEGFKVMCKCLLTLLRHAEAEDCTGEVKDSREEMEDYLTKL